MPVAGVPGPAFRLLRACGYIEEGAVCKRGAVVSCVALVWGDEADGAVEMLAVVPACEGMHPGLRISLGGKALGLPVGAVFAGPEQCLEKGIVIADAWAAVGRRDARFEPRRVCPRLIFVSYAAKVLLSRAS